MPREKNEEGGSCDKFGVDVQMLIGQSNRRKNAPHLAESQQVSIHETQEHDAIRLDYNTHIIE
jgi:hypothetical protein